MTGLAAEGAADDDPLPPPFFAHLRASAAEGPPRTAPKSIPYCAENRNHTPPKSHTAPRRKDTPQRAEGAALSLFFPGGAETGLKKRTLFPEKPPAFPAAGRFF